MEKERSYPVREPPPPKPKRVYKSVAVGEGAGGAYAVLLDGKPSLTPLRTPLATSSRALADAVAAEWDAQDPHIDPETMPLTRLLATALDRVAPQRDAVIASLLSYVDADSICYRASHPADLRARQNELWQPVVDWVSRQHNIALTSVDGLMPAAQPPQVGSNGGAQVAGIGNQAGACARTGRAGDRPCGSRRRRGRTPVARDHL